MAGKYETLITGWDRESAQYKDNRINCAVESAMGNAADTLGCLGSRTDREEWFSMAYGSLSCTSWFDEDEDVQEWFKVRGYRW